MKLFQMRKFSLLLAMVMVLSSVSMVAFAAEETTVAEDSPITVDITKFTNATGGASNEYNSKCNPKYTYDAVPDDEVISFKSDTFYTKRTAGSEPRIFLNPDTGTTDVALASGSINWKDYRYLRMSFNIYIGDDDDGFGFRTKRMNSDGTFNSVYTFVGIGGSGLTVPDSSSTLSVYSLKTLASGQWHNVVFELGSTESSIKIFIDGEENNLGNLTADTYGFGGAENRCVLTPMGASTNSKATQSIDLRLHDFTMTATNTAYVADATAAPLNTLVYEMTADSTFVEKGNNTITRTTDAVAPHITNKTAVRHYAESYKAASAASTESCYRTTTGSTAVSLGNIDYTKFNNLRIQFNIYIADSTNGVWFRAKRTTDGSNYTGNHYIFNIGGSDFKPATGSTSDTNTNYTYTYKGLETGKWHNVVMEIGAKSANTSVKYYVDGEAVEIVSSGALNATEYGFGGNENYSVLAMHAATGKTLDLYLSDVKMIACNTTHNPENVPAPTVEAADTFTGVIVDDVVYASSLAVADLTPVDADSINIVDNTDANDWVVVYNDTSKRVKYYDVISDGIHAVNVDLADAQSYDETNSVWVNKTKVTAQIVNFTQEDKTPYMLLTYYKTADDGSMKLVAVKKFNPAKVAAGTVGELTEKYANDLSADLDYDSRKLMVWENITTTYTPLAAAVEAGTHKDR